MSDTIQLLLTVAINLLVVFLVIRAVRSLKVADVVFEEAASKKI